MSEIERPGLLIPTPGDFADLNQSMVVKAIDARDFPDWESRLLDPKNDPCPHMEVERQQMSDCQGNATANGEEKRIWYCTGVMPKLSEMYAYNASEYVTGTQYVGRDSGTTMTSGVRVLTQGIKSLGVAPGLPLESIWAYSSYERSASRFATRAKATTIQKSHVTEHGPMPDFKGMLVALAAGGTGHIGTDWNVRWLELNGRKLMDRKPVGGGGHATEIIWAYKINGKWYLAVWNSHGYGYYLMSQRAYEEHRDWQPYGGYLLMPDRAAQRFEDRRVSGGGYILGNVA